MNPPNQTINTESKPEPGDDTLEPSTNFASLAATAQKILVEEDISLVLQSICQEACSVLGANHAMIAKNRVEGNKKREILSDYNMLPEHLERLQASETNPLYETALLEKKIKIFSDLSKVTRAFRPEDIRRMGLHTFCAIPLIIRNEAFGTLVLDHASPRDYTEQETNLAEAFGDLASIAIEKAQLVDSLQTRVSGQESLEHAVRHMTSGQSVDEIAQMVLAESERIMATERCTVILFEPREENPKLFVSRGVSDEFRKILSEVKFGRSLSPNLLVYRYIQNPEMTTPTITPDVVTSADLSENTKKFQLDHGHRALAAFPLISDGKTTGLLFYYWATPQKIDEQRISMGQAFADHVAIAIDKARHSQENQERALRFEILDQLTKAISSNLEPEELFRTIAREIRRVVDCDSLRIARFNDEGMGFYNYHEEGNSPSSFSVDTNSPKGLLAKEVFRTKKLINVPDTSDGWGQAILFKRGYRSALVVPIFRGDDCIAFIRLASRKAAAFGRDTEELLTSLSGHLNTAIQNAELFKAAGDRTKHLEIVGNIARVVGSKLELEELFETIIQEIKPYIPFKRCVFPSLIGWHNSFRAEWNDDTNMRTSALKGREGFDEWILSEVYQKKQARIIPDLLEFGAEWASKRAKEGFRSIMFVPILLEGRSIAHIGVSDEGVGVYTAEHESLLTAIAGYLSYAIRNADLYQALEERAQRLSALNVLGQKISENLDLQEVLDSIAKATADLLKGDATRIFLLDEETNTIHLRAFHGYESGIVSMKNVFRPGEGFIGKMVLSNETIIVDNIQSNPTWINTEWARKAGLNSAAGYPLRKGNIVIGGITCLSRKSDAYSQDDLDLLGALAAHAVNAIENARLHEEANRSREFFQSVVDDNTDAIMVVDLEQKIIHWNSGAEKLYGYTEEEVLGQNIDTIFVENDFMKYRNTDIQEGKAIDFETLRQRKDGSQVPVNITLSPVKNEDDEFIANATIHKDLTEKKEAERLRETHVQRLDTLTSLTQRISASMDTDEVLSFIANSAAELLDIPFTRVFILAGEMLELRAERGDMLVPKDRVSFLASQGAAGTALKTGKPCYIEDVRDSELWKNPEKQREADIGSYLAVPLKSGPAVFGILECMVHGVREFTSDELNLVETFAAQAAIAIENARLHEEGQRSLNFFRSVVDDNADAIMVLDLDRKFIHWNAGAEKLYGYTESEIIGKPIDTILPESQKGLNLTPKITRDRKSIHFEAERLRKDGSFVPVSISISPVINEEGELIATSTIQKDLTETKRAGEALRESEERYRSLIDFAADAIYVHDTDGRFIDMNHHACECLGYTRSELLNLSVRDISPTFNRERFNRQWKNLKEGGHLTLESTHKRKDGTIFPIELHTGKVELNGQQLVISLVRDITERQEAEEALRQSEAGLANAQRIARIGSWEWNIQMGESSWSDELYRIFGISPEDKTPPHKLYYRHVHPDDKEFIHNAEEETIRNKEPYRLDARIVRPDGSVRNIHEEAEIIKDETGKPLKLVGTTQDITERKRVEEALRQSEDRIRRIYGAASDAIFVLDIHNECIVETNPKAAVLLGYSEKEMYGLPISKIHPNEMSNMREIFRTLETENESLSSELFCTTRDNKKIPVEVSFSLFQIEDRDYVMAIARDIRERKEAESKLLLAMAEAEAASQAKSDFLSNMSHELRSPLNSIVGFSDLLIRDSGDEMTQMLAPKIKDSGHYLTSLIEDILDFDRIESGNVKLEMETTPINELVTKLVETQTPQLTEGHSMELHLDPSCGTVLCDPTRINQVIINLLDNAVKYSPNGGTIHVRTLYKGGEIWVSVDDNGLGIAPHEIDSIFERFHQLESGYQRRSGGLGIGLSLIRQLVQLHNGRIWVESEIDKGSIFTFALPKPKESSPGTNKSALSEKHLPANSDPWEHKSILIVDDVEHYHVYIKLLMSGASEIISANNGKEAIAAVKRSHPDLILMDLRMPFMNGFEAIKKIKSNPATQNIPIIAVSAQVTDEDKDRAIQVGANGFISKPIDIDSLKKEINWIFSTAK